MTNLKKEIPLILIVLLPFIYLGYIWGSLPDRVPVHWDGEGEINGWGSKTSLIILPFILPFLTYLIFSFVPLIDPKKKLSIMGDKFYNLKLATVLVMSTVALFILYSTKHQSSFNPNTLIMLVGLLFAIIGNYMPSLKQNYFIGIKTPWALENETVWKKTHQLAGKLWFPGGVLVIILSFLINDPKLMNYLFLSITGIIAIVPMIYSYIFYKKETQTNKPVH